MSVLTLGALELVILVKIKCTFLAFGSTVDLHRKKRLILCSTFRLLTQLIIVQL